MGSRQGLPILKATMVAMMTLLTKTKRMLVYSPGMYMAFGL
jgi:hypothetical protein